LSINAVLQRPKYNAEYPGQDAYYIDRTTIPNKLVFDVAPIWDQDFGAKSIGEPTAVERVVGIGVGNYKRLTVDYNLVDDQKSGPFLILDVEDLTVQSIDDKEYLYVFLDGVLQREGYSYTISGPNIYFNVPIKKEMKIDMRYLYGRDVGQILNVYDFAPDSYYAKSFVTIDTTAGINTLISYYWMGSQRGLPVQAFQVRQDGTYNVLGELSNIRTIGNQLQFDCFGYECELDPSLDLTFAVKGRYTLNTQVSFSDYSITYETDSDGRMILSTNDQIWSGTILGTTYRKPFVSLSNGDLIRVEGEDKFRRIKKLPGLTTSKEQRPQEQVSNSMFGTVDVERYNGITRGEGLSIVAIIENGVVVDLQWNQRSWNPLTQPTAYQYFTPPVVHFIPLDGNGGGARANVLVSKGQVISVDLIDGGSGYTKAPKVEVARRYDILSDREIGVSLINVGINPFIEHAGMIVTSTIDVLGNQVSGVNSFTSILFNSPVDASRKITAEIQLVRESGENLSREYIEFLDTIEPNADEIEVVTVSEEPTIVRVEIQDVISNTTISTNRQITTTVQNLLPNDALSNVNYYATGAYLDVDLDPTDTIVYIADTSKFKTNGYLLIGDEVVRYPRKLADRFLKVQRGQDNTTAKAWLAGTFLRQIPDLVSVAFGGVARIQSEAIVSISGGAVTGQSERETERQILSPSTSLSEQTTTEVLIIPPPTGVVDGYQESVFIADPIKTRLNGFVDISNDYGVVQRSGNIIFVKNSLFGAAGEYIGSYTKTNAGPTLKNFDQLVDDGVCNVSAISLLELEFHYPSLSIRDFEERGSSSYMLDGTYFNLTIPSIQNPVTISSSTGTIGGPIVVQDTTFFPNSGYLFTSGGSVVQYTSKTSTTFEGCSVTRGPNSITAGDELIPFDIT